MLRYMFRFALPGGRRVVVAYFPPNDEPATEAKPAKPQIEQPFDRVFAAHGMLVRLPNPERSRVIKRGR